MMAASGRCGTAWKSATVWTGSTSVTPATFRLWGIGTATVSRHPVSIGSSDGFVYLRDANTEGVADLEFFFGNPGDWPLVGDFDGDGKDTVSIFRESEARVYRRQSTR